MSATKPAMGQPRILASYESDNGRRQLVGQRIDGKVALSDIPTGDEGRVYLVERHLPCKAELEGLLADYLSLAVHLGRAPMKRDWIFDDA